MSRDRLVALGVTGFLAATIVSFLAWIPVIFAGLSGFCGESTTPAECSSRQSGAETGMIVAGLFCGGLALGALFLVVRAVSRPRGRKERWYLLGAALLLPMQTVSVLIGLVGTSPNTSWAARLGAMAAVAVLWMAAWCFAMRGLMLPAAPSPLTNPDLSASQTPGQALKSESPRADKPSQE